jgi:deoxyhypusine synthase
LDADGEDAGLDEVAAGLVDAGLVGAVVSTGASDAAGPSSEGFAGVHAVRAVSVTRSARSDRRTRRTIGRLYVSTSGMTAGT